MQKGKHYSIFVYFFSIYLKQFRPPWNLQCLFRLQFHWFVRDTPLRGILAFILLLTWRREIWQIQWDYKVGKLYLGGLAPGEKRG
jgi:hypothetical protein